MGTQTKHFYAFGPFRLDSEKRVLVRDGVPIALAPKAAETLLVLVQNAGRLVEKDELMATSTLLSSVCNFRSRSISFASDRVIVRLAW